MKAFWVEMSDQINDAENNEDFGLLFGDLPDEEGGDGHLEE